ncbi:MAG: DUF481 domain-containing protein [Pseudomonadota bacterium]
MIIEKRIQTLFITCVILFFSVNTLFADGRAGDTRTLNPNDLQNGNVYKIEAGLGTAQTTGNADISSLAANMAFNFNCKKQNFYIIGDLTYLEYNDIINRNDASAVARYDHTIFDNLKWFVYNTHAYNELLLLDYRLTGGTGPWYDFKLGTLLNAASLAITYEFEQFNGYANEHTPRLSYRHIFSYSINEIVSWNLDFFYVPKITDWSDVHIFLNTNLDITIYKDIIKIRLTLKDEYDSVPKTGVEENDMSFITSIVFNYNS